MILIKSLMFKSNFSLHKLWLLFHSRGIDGARLLIMPNGIKLLHRFINDNSH